MVTCKDARNVEILDCYDRSISYEWSYRASLQDQVYYHKANMLNSKQN